MFEIFRTTVRKRWTLITGMRYDLNFTAILFSQFNFFFILVTKYFHIMSIIIVFLFRFFDKIFSKNSYKYAHMGRKISYQIKVIRLFLMSKDFQLEKQLRSW